MKIEALKNPIDIKGTLSTNTSHYIALHRTPKLRMLVVNRLSTCSAETKQRANASEEGEKMKRARWALHTVKFPNSIS
jgi:hypothetical protein